MSYDLGRMAAEIEEASRQSQRYERLYFWRPYPKQSAFFAASKHCREVALFAGTQLGKSESASYKTAVHLTGAYPPDWPGRRWDRPVRAWAVGESTKMTRDIQQRKLCGEAGDPSALGSGMIPLHLILKDQIVYNTHGEKGSIDSISVRHASGGVSVLKFRSYQQGRESLQGETLDIVWADEEPDMAIYSELLGRVSGSGGQLTITMTPLKGMSDVCLRFLNEYDPGRTYIKFGINDLPVDGHIAPADRASIIAGYPEHEREARSSGVPMLGSGRIYTKDEASLIEDADPLSWPRYWKWAWAIDIGISHPCASTLMSYDVDQGIFHLVAEHRASNLTIGEHVSAMRQIETQVFGRHMDFMVAFPHDAGTRDKTSGAYVRDIYKKHGLRMMNEHATMLLKNGEKSFSLDGSIQSIIELERNNKLRINRSCLLYLEERRLYHRDAKGEVVAIRDDVLSAARYGIMSVRFWKSLYDSGLDGIDYSLRPPMSENARHNMSHGAGAVARDVDFDLFG